MRANVVRIGNSRGLRLPKPILEQCGIGELVDLVVEDGRLIVTPLRRPREGWAEAAQTAAARGDDQLLDPETPTTFDRTAWEW
jgi:antitoxin MazE